MKENGFANTERFVFLELLQINETESVVNFCFCMGELSIFLASQSCYVLECGEKLRSLKSLKKYAEDININNIDFVCCGLIDPPLPKKYFNIAVIDNIFSLAAGENIALSAKYGNKYNAITKYINKFQLSLLDGAYSTLKHNGRLLITHENRYSYKLLIGGKSIYPGMRFITLIPKFFVRMIQSVASGDKYKFNSYSFFELERVLIQSGFKKIDLYACWVDNGDITNINNYRELNKFHTLTSRRNINGEIEVRRVILNALEWILFKKLNLNFFAPYIISIAHK